MQVLEAVLVGHGLVSPHLLVTLAVVLKQLLAQVLTQVRQMPH